MRSESDKNMQKTHTAISLRTKLISAIAAIVALASCPLLYFGYTDAYDHSLVAEQEKISSITRLIHEDLQLGYLNSQAVVTEKVAIEKDDILSELDAMEEWISSDQLGQKEDVFAFMEKQWKTYSAVVSPWGDFMRMSPTIARVWHLNAKDYQGVPFKDYLGRLNDRFYRDYFTYIDFEDNGVHERLLVAIRRVAGNTAIVMQNLDYLEEQLQERERAFKNGVRARVQSMSMNPEIDLLVLSDTGEVIARRGPGHLYLSMLEGGILQKAQQEETISGELEKDDLLYNIAYFKSLGWYICSSVPVDVVAQPARDYAQNLVTVILIIFGLIALGGMVLISRVLKPLGVIGNAAARLEKHDFAASDATHDLSDIVSQLPNLRRDELGQVSRAFSGMVVALEKNIENLKKSLAREHSIQGELNAASEIQQGMLSAGDGSFQALGMNAFALMQAAKEVGGDFYDVMTLPGGRRALIVGDVSGKGVSAALLMCVSLTLARNALADGMCPATVIQKVNDQLAVNNPSCMFVTLWVGVLDPATGYLVYANGGHCPPAVVSSTTNRPIHWLRDVSGPLVGVFDGASYTEFETTLEVGDTCFVYTDGVSEAMNSKKVLFGEEGLASVLDAQRQLDPKTLVGKMMQAIEEHRLEEPQSDDITMLVFQRTKTGE